MLLKWGTDLADQAGLTCYLEASPGPAYELYRKAGFEDVDTVEVDLAPFGEFEEERHAVMTRQPAKG